MTELGGHSAEFDLHNQSPFPFNYFASGPRPVTQMLGDLPREPHPLWHE